MEPHDLRDDDPYNSSWTPPSEPAALPSLPRNPLAFRDGIVIPPSRHYIRNIERVSTRAANIALIGPFAGFLLGGSLITAGLSVGIDELAEKLAPVYEPSPAPSQRASNLPWYLIFGGTVVLVGGVTASICGSKAYERRQSLNEIVRDVQRNPQR